MNNKMNNLKIIGTTHLDSMESIVKKIKEFNPEIIGVELCRTRFDLLNKEQSSTNEVGGGIIDKISQSIKKKAEEENVQYGSDMITASAYAIEKKIPLSFLDKDITEIKRLMELLPKNEQVGFLTELAKFEEKTLREQTKNIDEDEVLKELRTKYPVSFEFLVNSRDLFIAFNILKLISQYPHKKILIFIGKGHLKSIEKLFRTKKLFKNE